MESHRRRGVTTNTPLHQPEHVEAAGGIEPPYGALQAPASSVLTRDLLAESHANHTNIPRSLRGTTLQLPSPPVAQAAPGPHLSGSSSAAVETFDVTSHRSQIALAGSTDCPRTGNHRSVPMPRQAARACHSGRFKSSLSSNQATSAP